MAKSLSEKEIDDLCIELNSLKGALLTQCLFDDKALLLNFNSESQFYWLVFSMKPGNAFAFLSPDKIELIKNKKKPLNLFVKTHLLQKSFVKASRDQERGRVVVLQFESNGSIELNFIPGRVNVTVTANEKSVSAFKPKPLAENKEGEASEQQRPPFFFQELWQSQRKKSPKDSSQDLKKELKKKRNGLEKMQEKLEKLMYSPWQDLGEWLTSHQKMQGVPEKLASLIESQQSLAWNIENAFSQSKKDKAKVAGTLERIEVLQNEITELEQGKSKKTTSKLTKKSLLAEANLKGRTIQLPDGRLFIGRSGKENLQLLRKAKPWFLWLHIKDYPGAYGIMERNKKQGDLDGKSLKIAAEAVIKESLPKGQNGVFEVIYAECRYVRPIKGAKSGQVTYSHEKVVSVRVGE